MKVKIKTWEQMEREYGLTSLGDISTPGANFVDTMEEIMPQDRIIEVEKYGDRYKWKGWVITNDMIEEFVASEGHMPIITPRGETLIHKHNIPAFPEEKIRELLSQHIEPLPPLRGEPFPPVKRRRVKKRNYNLNY